MPIVLACAVVIGAVAAPFGRFVCAVECENSTYAASVGTLQHPLPGPTVPQAARTLSLTQAHCAAQ
jgi:hypothetical protein